MQCCVTEPESPHCWHLDWHCATRQVEAVQLTALLQLQQCLCFSIISPGFPAFAMLLLPLWQILLFLCWQNVPALGTSPGHILFPSSVTGALFLFHQLSYLFICLFIHSQFLFLSSPWRKPCFCGGSLHCQPVPCRQVVRRDC